MMWDTHTIEMIHYEIKNETRRLYNPKRRPGIPGHIQKLKIDRTPNVWGQIKILSCEPQRFGDMTEKDAHNEGFLSLKEYKEYFYKINKRISDDDLVWVVKFEKLWTTFYVENPPKVQI